MTPSWVAWKSKVSKLTLDQQTLVSHAVRIADQYRPSQSTTYKAAAQNLRLPYWDWGLQARLPTAATVKNVTVNGPEGNLTLRNPLYSYRFQRPSVLSQFGGELSEYPETVRCGGPGSNNATVSNQLLSDVATTLVNYVVRPPNLSIASELCALGSFQNCVAPCGAMLASLINTDKK